MKEEDLAGIFPEIKPGSVVCLRGELGAGKTTFVRSWIDAQQPGAGRMVSSPTFILHAKHKLEQGAVHHFDWYRLESPQEIISMGWDDVLSDDYLAIFVEWGDKFPELLPEKHIQIDFSHIPGNQDERDIQIISKDAG